MYSYLHFSNETGHISYFIRFVIRYLTKLALRFLFIRQKTKSYLYLLSFAARFESVDYFKRNWKNSKTESLEIEAFKKS